MSDRVVVLTGGTSGIGRRAALDLAAEGATVAVVGRDPDRGESLSAAVASDGRGDVAFHRTDLAEMSAVRSLAADLRSSYDRIDALVHNAGLSAHERTETADGIELTLAVNHLAPYLLTRELYDALATSPDGARVVVTSSGLHRRETLQFDDLGREGAYDPVAAYARSKLANVAFTLELAARIPPDHDVTANCFTPGLVPSTRLFRDAPLRTRLAVRLAGVVPGVASSEAEGARRLRSLVTDPRYGEQSGLYVGDDGPEQPSDEASDPAVRERLWNASADLVGVDPDWPTP